MLTPNTCPACGEPLSEYGHCWQCHYPPMDPRPASPPDGYLTWAQLRDYLNQVADLRILAEPVLCSVLDGYDNEAAYPVELLPQSIHPQEQATLVYDKDNEEYELIYNTEGCEGRKLRVLPPGGLVLHFSEQDEGSKQRTKWLAQPNPHIPPPVPAVPAVPGRAPLFE